MNQIVQWNKMTDKVHSSINLVEVVFILFTMAT